MKLKQLSCCVMAAVMALPLAAPMPSYATAGKFNDTRDHWAADYIDTAVSKRFVSGYPDGRFLPDKAVTRAEFASMINKALGVTAQANLSFNDVSRSEWYYDDIAKAVAAAYTGGYDDNSFRPDSPITRQEAAVMISRIVPAYGAKGNLKAFSDYRSIADWAYDSLEKVNGKGYLGAYNDGRIHPGDKLTRGQTAKIICDILDKESIVTSSTTVKKDGTKLSGKIYANGVVMDEDLDDGSASIENCIILGTLSIRGGGDSTVTLTNSRVANAIVDKDDDPVRVLAKGETTVVKLSGSQAFTLQTSSLSGGLFGLGFSEVTVASAGKATLKGSFPMITVSGSKAELTLSSGTIKNLTVGGRYSNITASSGTTIDNCEVNSESYFHGTGTISHMDVNAKGITYETKPKKWTIASSANTPVKGEEEAEITFSPKNGATKVKLDTKITITFGSAIKKYGGGSITSSDIEDFVEVRKNSSSGSEISYTASINSAKTVITITPDKALSADTKYYVVIPKNSVRDSDGNGNTVQSSYFTTGESYGAVKTVFSPANGATAVPVGTSITITLSEAVVRYSNGATISSGDSYLDDCIVFKKNDASGSSVSYSATINSSKKVITITPKSDLILNQKYYVAVVGKKLKTKAGEESVEGAAATWTTGIITPVLSTFTVNAGDTTMSVTATPNVAGKIYAVVLPSGSPAPSAAQIAAGQNNSGAPALAVSKNENVAASASVTLPSINGLGSGVSYDVWVTLYANGSGTYSAPVKKAITTTLPKISLNGLTVKPLVDGTARDSEVSFKSGTTSYTVSLNSSINEVELRAQGDLGGEILMTGNGIGKVSATGSLNTTVEIASNPTLTITISRPGSTPTTYTVNLRNSNETSLKSLKIDGSSQTTGSSSYTYALSTTGSAIVSLNIAANDKFAGITDPSGTNVSVIDSNSSLGAAAFKLEIPEGSEPVAVEFEVVSGSSAKSYYILFTRP